jgi:translation initiation factor 2B subunit (eIF-2B alpha/beta/delta family)
MTSIHQALKQQLENLHQLLIELDDESYCYASPLLTNASIGQHSRHIIELVQCLVNGYEDGLVNYDKRNRDKQIENSRIHAMNAIQFLFSAIDKKDKEILVEGSFDDSCSRKEVVTSSYSRELIYNIEHAVHHMALIKVALNELKLEIKNEAFGVAYATIQYRKLCVQ